MSMITEVQPSTDQCAPVQYRRVAERYTIHCKLKRDSFLVWMWDIINAATCLCAPVSFCLTHNCTARWKHCSHLLRRCKTLPKSPLWN